VADRFLSGAVARLLDSAPPTLCVLDPAASGRADACTATLTAIAGRSPFGGEDVILQALLLVLFFGAVFGAFLVVLGLVSWLLEERKHGKA
jgi:hypothetical protein